MAGIEDAWLPIPWSGQGVPLRAFRATGTPRRVPPARVGLKELLVYGWRNGWPLLKCFAALQRA